MVSGRRASNSILRPNLVDMSRAVKDEWRLKFTPEVGRYAKFPERRREMEHGVMGDPHVASAEKGEKAFRVLVKTIGGPVSRVSRQSNRRDIESSGVTAFR